MNRPTRLAGYTALHWAADCDLPNPKLVQLLLDNGAKINIQAGADSDNFGGVTQNSLMLAARRGNTSVVELLERQGAEQLEDPWALRRPTPPTRSLPEGKPSQRLLRQAVVRALPPLEKSVLMSNGEFVEKNRACTSCHQHYLPLLASAAAKDKGISRDESVAATIREAIEQETTRFEDVFFQPNLHMASGQGRGLALMSLAAEGHSANRSTDAVVTLLMATQAPQGNWINSIPRPPIQATDVDATALAVRGLTLYPIPGRQKGIEAALSQARSWLRDVQPESPCDRIFQLLGLAWAGAPHETLEPMARALVDQQRDDGGWAQLPGLQSDAYATGLALFALRESLGSQSAPDAYQRGLKYLLRTQLADGTWYVRRRAFPYQPTRRSGFPHGRDGWVSAAASSWAILALAGALDELSPGESRDELTSQSDKGESTRGQAPDVLPPATKRPVDFARDIQPLLQRSCAGCHSGKRVRGRFSADNRERLLAGGRSGDAAIVPGQSAESLLVRYVSDQEENFEMPPLSKREKYPKLTCEEIGLLRAWIDQGATWNRRRSI